MAPVAKGGRESARTFSSSERWRNQESSFNRHARLARWADLLERQPDRVLPLLTSVQFLKRCEWLDLRAEGTALEIAYKDPLFRIDGLKGDRVGEALRYFELSDSDACRIFCGSRRVRARSARATAHRVRNIADKRHEHVLLAIMLLVTIIAAIACAALVELLSNRA